MNDKSDDDDSPNSNNLNSELLRQLKKPNKDDHKEPNNNSNLLDHEQLMQRLQFQGNNTVNPNGRKRTSDESDDSNSSAKRFGDGSRQPSKLQEKNKMLASLLANPLKTPPTMPHNVTPVRIIPDITHNINNINNRLTSSNQTPQLVTPQPLQINNNNNNTINKNSNSMKAQQAKNRQAQARAAANLKPSAENYLNQMPQQQPNPQQMLQNQMHQSSRQLQAASQNLPPGSIQNYQIDSGQQQYAPSSSTNSTPATSSTHQLAQTTDWEDTELNDILEKVIDFVPDGSYSDGDITSLLSFSNIDSSTALTTPSQSKQQEEIAKIQKIQQSLMEFEGDNNIYSPPAYPLHGLTPQQQNQVLQQRQQQQMAGQCFPQPPPVYTQRNVRLAQQSQLVSNSTAPTAAQSTNSQQGNKQQQNAIMQQRMQLQRMVQQQHQKERLLQAQQGQQMLVPSNATASAEQLCKYFL